MTLYAVDQPLTSYAGRAAHVVATPRLAAIVVPERGAKIVGLRDLRSGREWLVQPVNSAFEPTTYGAPFRSAGTSGWDELFPTIEACGSPDNPGVVYPDHGELWSRAWRVTEATEDRLTTQIDGVVLPYRFVRTISVIGESTLRLEYEVTATGPDSITVLWAARAQFAARPGTRLVLPPSVTSVLDVHFDPEGPARLTWPAEGLDQVRTLTAGSCLRFYVEPGNSPAHASLVDTAGNWLRLDWNTKDVPYLGLWLDAGAYAPEPAVALEPSNGFYSSLARAASLGRAARIAPGATRRWSLTVSVGLDALPDEQ